MADMLKVFVAQEIENQIKENYSHLQYPACVYAKVVKVKEISEKYICTLKILDKNKSPDSSFPEVPFVSTDINLSKGDIAVVVLLYGECNPFIIGRYD